MKNKYCENNKSSLIKTDSKSINFNSIDFVCKNFEYTTNEDDIKKNLNHNYIFEVKEVFEIISSILNGKEDISNYFLTNGSKNVFYTKTCTYEIDFFFGLNIEQSARGNTEFFKRIRVFYKN